MIAHSLAGPVLSLLLTAVGIPSIAAQAGPPCGPDLPIKCTPGKDAALVLGFVGAGALAVYLAYRMDHPRGEVSVSGCTILANGVMTLTEQGTQTSFLLTPSRKKVKADEQVILRGKKSRDAAGQNVLRVTKIVRDEGPCEPPRAERGAQQGESPNLE